MMDIVLLVVGLLSTGIIFIGLGALCFIVPMTIIVVISALVSEHQRIQRSKGPPV